MRHKVLLSAFFGLVLSTAFYHLTNALHAKQLRESWLEPLLREPNWYLIAGTVTVVAWLVAGLQEGLGSAVMTATAVVAGYVLANLTDFHAYAGLGLGFVCAVAIVGAANWAARGLPTSGQYALEQRRADWHVYAAQGVAVAAMLNASLAMGIGACILAVIYGGILQIRVDRAMSRVYGYRDSSITRLIPRALRGKKAA